MSPRTPQIGTQPLFFALCAISQKDGGRVCANPWIYAFKLYKSLIVERNLPTGSSRFSTDCASVSTDSTVFSTGSLFQSTAYIYIYLSLLKEERRRKRAWKRKAPIHGLAELLKNASTGYDPHPRVIRGFTRDKYRE
ncbi:hypothetical protein SAMN05216316_0727 [Nitrosovibrio sp. Nv6]|nr:hypothetical protein SAMN05216316_0727 [Nitrosovibrio sp. Nv6]